MPAPLPELLTNALAVGAGGFVGAIARYLVGLAVPAHSSGFPVSTFLVNIVGAFVIAFVTTLTLRHLQIDYRLFLFITTGVCGGFTTFSTFSWESLRLLEGGQIAVAALYIIGSVSACIIAAFAGQAASEHLVG